MAVELTPLGNPIRNTTDEVLKFTGLTFEDIEPSRVDFFRELAADRVEARSPYGRSESY